MTVLIVAGLLVAAACSCFFLRSIVSWSKVNGRLVARQRMFLAASRAAL
jgi:hypothetical protein